jgi:hypothetical protein
MPKKIFPSPAENTDWDALTAALVVGVNGSSPT